jgi:transcriptional regulator with XRE-family HTH domain
MDFENKLQMLRKQSCLSQEELAEKVAVSRQSVAKWESGQAYPDVNNLLALGKLFNISIDRLVKADFDACVLKLNSANVPINENMVEFLCRAKKSTYAAKGAEIQASRPKAHDFKYVDGEYLYIDSYIGGEQFAGEEAVWIQDMPVWSMNYCGRVLDESFSGDFLKEALLLVPEEYPFRGPSIYQNGEYSYHCIISGNLVWFQGYEEIFYANQKVYECYFHGGSIK